MNRTSASTVTLAAAVLAGVTLALGSAAARQQNVAIDKDDLAGVVTSAQGTGSRGLGHCRDQRSADQVREDRGHRRSRPVSDPGPAGGEVQRVGAGLRSRRLAEGAGVAGHEPEPQCRHRTERPRGGGVLPRRLLVLADEGAAGQRLPRHRAVGQRHCAEHAQPGRVAAPDEERHLPRVPPAREQGDARNSCRARHLLVDDAGVGAAARLGSGGLEHDPVDEPDRPRALSLGPRRLDRSHQGRRASAGSAAAAGPRAQRRDHHVGLGRSQGLPARRRLDRSPQSDGERERAALRSARVECGLRARPRSERE